MDGLGVKEWIEIGVTVGTVFISLGTAFWRFNTWINRSLNSIESLGSQVKDLAEQQKKTSRHIAVLSNAIGELRKETKDREKDVARLEGSLSAMQTGSQAVSRDIQTTRTSIDALWRTLHTAFPDKIPKRAIDKF